MRNTIQLKKATAIVTGEYLLCPQHTGSVLLARRVVSIETIDDGKRVEVGDDKGILHLLNADDVVAVVT